MTRTVRETVPGALANVPATHAARNTYLTNLSRDLSANAAYLIGTRYGDVPALSRPSDFTRRALSDHLLHNAEC